MNRLEKLEKEFYKELKIMSATRKNIVAIKLENHDGSLFVTDKLYTLLKKILVEGAKTLPNNKPIDYGTI
jgi:hypothetical protein